MTGRLAGRSALVTGAAQGMGAAIAERLAAEGALVALVDVSADGAAATAHRIGDDRAIGIAADVSSREDVRAAVATTVDAFGHLDIAVAHAGIAAVTGFLDIDDGEWDRMLAVNLTGAFYTIQEAARRMAAGGSIVATSSQNAFFPQYGTAAYSTTKAGLLTLVKNAAMDLAARGIRVNAISPGFIDTPLAAPLVNNPRTSATVVGTVPMRRFGTAAEVAGCVAFLASDDASYVTGANLVADGGATLGMSMGDEAIDLPGFAQTTREGGPYSGGAG
jgi:NAD(P)-dependent dehydrogenase (short-subunit alcohol dehydrogenase family)